MGTEQKSSLIFEVPAFRHMKLPEHLEAPPNACPQVNIYELFVPVDKRRRQCTISLILSF